MEGKSGNAYIYKLIKATEFMLTPSLTMLLAKILARKTFWRKIKNYYMILNVINIILQTITLFIPLMFNINQDSTYSRTTLGYGYLVIQAFCVVLWLISANNTFIQSVTKYNISLYAIVTLVVVGVLIRLVDKNSDWDWICITLGYFLVYNYFTNGYLKIDSLTSLLNRRAYENRLPRINYSTAIIVIDANDFKSINDTYGHQCGDEALASIADSILNTYRNIGYCYRIGGDEFAIILRPGMLQALTSETQNYDGYQMLENWMSKLNTNLAKKAESNTVLENGVSQGAGIYFSPIEYPSIEPKKTIDEVIKIADARMYEDKDKNKKKKKKI